MSKSGTSSSGGIGFAGLLTIVFITIGFAVVIFIIAICAALAIVFY
jgi:hypothetical protein